MTDIKKGDKVRVKRMFGQGKKWLYGTVEKVTTGITRAYGEDLAHPVYRLVSADGARFEADTWDNIELVSVIDKLAQIGNDEALRSVLTDDPAMLAYAQGAFGFPRKGAR